MPYSQTGIANLALNRIGARGEITDINQNSPNAKKVLIVWDSIFQEVLSERDWKFAKIRTELQKSTQTPLYAYRHAWALPTDFMRFVRPHKRPPDQNYYFWGWGIEGYGWYNRQDPPFWPHGYPYVVETLPAITSFMANIAGYTLTVSQVTSGKLLLNQPIYDTTGQVPLGTIITAFGTGDGYSGTYTVSNSATVADEPMTSPNPLLGGSKYALTDYNGCAGPAKINYIRLISDYTQLMPGFVNCLAFRLAQELSIGVTEDKQKFEQMSQMYRDSLNSAEAQNETMDFQKDETGSETWERAGRYVGRWW